MCIQILNSQGESQIERERMREKERDREREIAGLSQWISGSSQILKFLLHL